MELTLGSHYVYHCRYHIVLPTKYRRKIFNDGTFSFFKKCVEIICKRYPQIEILEINHDRDHIHMLISVAPSISVGNVVRIIKTNTSRQMRERYAFLEKTYFRHDGIWSDGYFVSTAGIDETIIKKYIEQQGQKDLGRLKVVW